MSRHDVIVKTDVSSSGKVRRHHHWCDIAALQHSPAAHRTYLDRAARIDQGRKSSKQWEVVALRHSRGSSLVSVCSLEQNSVPEVCRAGWLADAIVQV